MQQTILIAFPSSLREQLKIAGLLSWMTVRYDTEVCLLDKLRELKSGLTADLLTGRVRVLEEAAVAP